ncbi:ribokinase [Quadrisphaera sp. GCM10027208]|uniref:ribokinase n=1 Tax=Quadrisphaera sp. GCM10027208 TaxID=3273423 RepID=UPI003606A637
MTGERTGGVCVVGSLNIDSTLVVSALPTAGQTVLARERHTSPGGKGANQAVAAAAVGSRVRFVGAIGDDADGRLGLATLAGRGIDVSDVLVLEAVPTGTAVVVVDDRGENLIVVDAGANGRLDDAWTARAVTAGDDAVLLAQLEVPVDALLAAAGAWQGRWFVLNPAPMGDAGEIARLLPAVDVLVPNRTELGELVGRPTPHTTEEVQACAEALAFEGTLVVTLGGDGAAVFAPGGRLVEHVPAPTVDVVDTSGAGDAFCGVLAHELTRTGGDVVPAVRVAVELAAASTRHLGAQVPPSFGSASETVPS